MVSINTKSLKADILEAYREAKSQLHMANMEIAELKEAGVEVQQEGIDELKAGWQKDQKILDHYRKVMSEIVALEVEDHFDDVSDELVDYIKGLKANELKMKKNLENDISVTIKSMMRTAMDEMMAEDKVELEALKIEIAKNKKERGIMTDIADANGWDIYPTDNEESDVELTDSDEETPKCDICGCDGTDMGDDVWNGETGCCLKCEADKVELEALKPKATAWKIINFGCDWEDIAMLCDEEMARGLVDTGECEWDDFSTCEFYKEEEEEKLKAGWAEEVAELSEKMSKKMKV